MRVANGTLTDVQIIDLIEKVLSPSVDPHYLGGSIGSGSLPSPSINGVRETKMSMGKILREM